MVTLLSGIVVFELLCRPLVSIRFTERPRHVTSDLSMTGRLDRSRLVLRCCLRALLEYANHPAQTKLVGHLAEPGRKKRFAKRICTWPPLARALNNRSVSASLAAEMV